ncbi:MAG: DNA mismatch repair protein MutS [Maricaulaceae bacterium]
MTEPQKKQTEALKEPKKSSKLTPMMAQYMAIKETAGEDVLLFYRMGDFYELFFDDAVNAAQALDIALTKRGKHDGAYIPMCGVPVHAANTYLPKLIKKGFRVAVCEQTESPAEAKKRGYKSVVNREIVRVVTPGTITEDNLLDARGSNFIACIAKSLAGDYALAWADVSDGLFRVCHVGASRLFSEVAALSARELILPEALYQTPDFISKLNMPAAALTPLPSPKFDKRNGESRLKSRFEVGSLAGFGAFTPVEISACGALLDYLELTQAGKRVELSPPQQQSMSGYMAIDPATRRSLEIEHTQRGQRKGSLLSVIDKTVTGPGARLLATRVARPLVDVDSINHRLDAVDFFVSRTDIRDDIRTHLRACGDMQRALSRLLLGRGGPRDLKTLSVTLKQGELLSALFARYPSLDIPHNVQAALNMVSLSDKGVLGKLVQDLNKALEEDVPLLARDGKFIATGWSPELDQLKTLRDESRKIIAGLQAEYAKVANVPTLKIKHNNVLGFFIEVTPKYADEMLSKGADSQFIHRQTLVSGVRFTTTDLAELDAKISGAGDKALAIEIALFDGFVARVAEQADMIRNMATALAGLDVATAAALWAETAKACRPVVDMSLRFDVKGGRHSVVEAALKAEANQPFTPNDCQLDTDGDIGNRLVVITGPNMAGKSTFLRQNALMLILAQSGYFIPAESAHIGVADQLFSRVGASDDLSKGQSTFMVEMIETAAILNLAGPRSFVILDEIGRGTATFDGLSIAWAAVEYLYEVNKSRALFATHYHELTDLAESLPLAGNSCLHAKEWENDLIFLHDVRAGAADKSYGVQVAKLAGLPKAAVDRARDVLTRLEADHDGTEARLGNLPLFAAPSPSLAPREPSPVEHALAALDVNDLSPRAALDLLYELKSKLEVDAS